MAKQGNRSQTSSGTKQKLELQVSSMAGSYNLFDAVSSTTDCESRNGVAVDTLQPHHATMTSISALIDIMQPGGRTVSANGAMANDGTLYEVVPLWLRAWTSASDFDARCLTVEACNTTLGPEWGLSDATHRRFGKLAADMLKLGILKHLRIGEAGGIVPHNMVPGSYATACPGPCFNYDLIVQYALEYLNPPKKKVDTEMPQIITLVGGDLALVGTAKGSRGFKADSPEGRILIKARDNKQMVGSETVTLGNLYESVSKGVELTQAAADAIGKAIAAGITIPSGPTAAEIAKAVNDDAAIRLKS